MLNALAHKFMLRFPLFIAFVFMLLGISKAQQVNEKDSAPIQAGTIFFIEPKKELLLNGQTFKFSQARLENSYSVMLNLLKDSVEKSNPDRAAILAGDSATQMRARSLAYCIIAAGEFSNSTEGLQNLMKNTIALLGDQLIPDGITWPEQQYLAAAAMAFTDSSDASIETEGIIEKNRTSFKDLVEMARLKINAREKH